jgi:hypothetical protein
MANEKTFKLRYVGARFAGARLPVNVLSDLPAFRDLLVSFAKDEWKKLHPDRQRVPKGFDASLSFDLTMIEEGSAVPNIVWNRTEAQANLPGFEDELEEVVDASYRDIVHLFDSAGGAGAIGELSPEKIRALDKFGAGLQGGEQIEVGESPAGNVVYLDAARRKRLITSARETYNTRLTGVGKLASNSVYGLIIVRAENGQDMSIPVDPEEILRDFDGSLDQDIQYDVMVELDQNDVVRKVVEVFDVAVVDASIEAGMLRCRERLVEISHLPEGWHDGTGSAINPVAIAAAEAFLKVRSFCTPKLKIYPDEAGGVLLEVEQNGWDISIEFSADGTIELYGIESEGDEELDPVGFETVGDEFLAEFDKRIGR